METELEAVNGRRVRAIEVFAHALRFFREHALKVRWTTPVCDSRTVWKCLASNQNLLSWSYHKFVFVFRPAPGGEGSVVVGVGRRGDQMGDHCSGCMETTSQTVHERGSVLGRNTHNGTQVQINVDCQEAKNGYRVALHLCNWKEMPHKKHDWIKVQTENHLLFSHTLSILTPTLNNVCIMLHFCLHSPSISSRLEGSVRTQIGMQRRVLSQNTSTRMN